MQLSSCYFLIKLKQLFVLIFVDGFCLNEGQILDVTPIFIIKVLATYLTEVSMYTHETSKK